MIALDVDIQNLVPLASEIAGLRSQVPYAASVAINQTLDSAQAAIRQTLPGEFTLRRETFISQTIYIAPKDRARKDNLVGTVRVNPARDFLAKFEVGGEKTGRAGHSLAIPILRTTDKTLIIKRGDPLSLRSVMSAIDAGHGLLQRGQRGRKIGPTKRVKGTSVYLVKSAKGTFVIQRTGESTRVLYAFERTVPIPGSLHFDETAMKAALASWETNAEAAIARAIATMR